MGKTEAEGLHCKMFSAFCCYVVHPTALNGSFNGRHFAAQRGNRAKELVQVLLRHGASTNVADSRNKSPAMVARDPEVAKLLK